MASCGLFGRLAEVVNEYLKKGRPVYVEGRLRTRKWQDQGGQDRYTTEIVADQMQLLGGRDGAPAGMPRRRMARRRPWPQALPQQATKARANPVVGRKPALTILTTTFRFSSTAPLTLEKPGWSQASSRVFFG